VRLFSPIHISLLAAIAGAAILLAILCRRGLLPARAVRLTLGWGLALNEIVWLIFHYSHEGVFAQNLPLQLCDLTVWLAVVGCLTLRPFAVEFAYLVGMVSVGLTLLTPDLYSPWPSYPAIYFFLGHGGIVIAVATLVFGRIALLRPGAVWRAFGLLLLYAVLIGAVNKIFHANYMYLCHTPTNPTLMDQMGPWPIYLVVSALLALTLFWLLYLPARVRTPQHREH
jgi:hypothetical integral membrane protein (TIGR02206 family)